jgi:hypothetical protein
MVPALIEHAGPRPLPGPEHRVDAARWQVDMRLEKRHEDMAEWVGNLMRLGSTREQAEAHFFENTAPYEVVESKGNLLLNAGIARMEDLLIGALTGTTNVFSNGNSRVGVGNSTTAASASQTDLQAAAGSANRQFKVMDATYPSRSGQTVTWQSSFTSAEANFVWNEWGIDFTNTAANGTTVGTTMLNRKVESLGTKTTGTWTLQVAVTIS